MKFNEGQENLQTHGKSRVNLSFPKKQSEVEDTNNHRLENIK